MWFDWSLNFTETGNSDFYRKLFCGMLVQEGGLVLVEPEHPRLEQYVVDNPGVTVVGLGWVTEFQVLQAGRRAL